MNKLEDVPIAFNSDNGGVFIDKIKAAFKLIWGVGHVFTGVKCPWQNPFVENGNNSVDKLLETEGDDFDNPQRAKRTSRQRLQSVLAILNNKTDKTVGMTPNRVFTLCRRSESRLEHWMMGEEAEATVREAPDAKRLNCLAKEIEKWRCGAGFRKDIEKLESAKHTHMKMILEKKQSRDVENMIRYFSRLFLQSLISFNLL